MKRRRKKGGILRRVLAAVAAVAVLAVGFAVFCRLHVDAARADGVYPITDVASVPSGDYAIVPGAAIYENRIMSWHMQDRLDTAIRLYEAGKVRTILLSGGFSAVNGEYEAHMMRDYALQKGVPAKDIVVDNAGVDTLDTLLRAKEYFGDKKALICTQDMFAARTLYLARAAGLKSSVAAADIQEYAWNPLNDVREFFAPTKAFLDVQLGAKAAQTVGQYPYETR
jgi:SanA protein